MRIAALTFALLMSTVPPAHAVVGDEDQENISACLREWKTHPFKDKNPDYRVIHAQVKVMGIGGDIEDLNKTEKPELVLIKPTVSVMSKNVMNLMNPNAWYCLKGKVSVLGKTEINLDCAAHIASSVEGATVLGKSDSDGDTTILGKSVLQRVNCGSKKEPKTSN